MTTVHVVGLPHTRHGRAARPSGATVVGATGPTGPTSVTGGTGAAAADVATLTAFVGLGAPTNAQSVAAIKSLIRVLGAIVRD